MAIYTVTLEELIQNNFDFGLQDYPIYKEDHRKELNDKIIEHFYFREIGLETPELFKRFLNRKMKEIMPYYNQLYKSEDIEYNPLFNIDITETYEHATESTGNMSQTGQVNDSTSATGKLTGKNTTDTKGDNFNAESDTPKSGVSLDEIKNNKYVSKTNYVNDNSLATEDSTQDSINSSTGEQTSNSNANSVQSNNENYVRKTEGSSAGLPFSKAIKQWREVMLNIDMQIIEELEPLFMGLW